MSTLTLNDDDAFEATPLTPEWCDPEILDEQIDLTYGVSPQSRYTMSTPRRMVMTIPYLMETQTKR